MLAACVRALLAAGDDGAAALRRVSRHFTPWLFQIAVSRVTSAVSVVLAVDVLCILFHAHPPSCSTAAMMLSKGLDMWESMHDELQEAASARALLFCCLLWSVRKQADDAACSRNRDELINAGLSVVLHSLMQLERQHVVSVSTWHVLQAGEAAAISVLCFELRSLLAKSDVQQSLSAAPSAMLHLIRDYILSAADQSSLELAQVWLRSPCGPMLTPLVSELLNQLLVLPSVHDQSQSHSYLQLLNCLMKTQCKSIVSLVHRLLY